MFSFGLSLFFVLHVGHNCHSDMRKRGGLNTAELNLDFSQFWF